MNTKIKKKILQCMNVLFVKGYGSNCKLFILLKKTQQLGKYVSSLETTKPELLGNFCVCCICTKLIVINKEPKYLVLHNISTNLIINSMSNIYELEERLIVPRQAFA